MRHRLRPVAVAVAAGLTLSGCGVPERVVGLHDAPVEVMSGAAFSEVAAEQITARVLGDAATASALTGSDAEKRRSAVLTGPALRLAGVDQKFAPPMEGKELAAPRAPRILALTAGRGWPRAILAATERGAVVTLHVLTATSATSPFKLWVSVPMEAGASVPALPPVADGTTLPEGREGRVATARQVLESYADQLDVPANTARSAIVGVTDAFATGLDASSAAQVKALGKLGTLSRRNAVIVDDILGFRLADGGLIAFGQMTRTDLVEPTSKAKRLDLPRDLVKLSGKKAVTKSLELRWLETIAVVVPATGAATVVGVEERMRGITAR